MIDLIEEKLKYLLSMRKSQNLSNTKNLLNSRQYNIQKNPQFMFNYNQGT